MRRQIFVASVLREEWDHDARVYRRLSETGAQEESRPYTAEENAQADADLAAAATDANETNLRNAAAGQVLDNLRQIASGTGTFATAAIRDAAIRTCARGLVILIRLHLRRLDATD